MVKKNKPTVEDLMKEIRKLKDECLSLSTLNQSLVDELDAFYDDGDDVVLDLLSMINEEPSRGTLQ